MTITRDSLREQVKRMFPEAIFTDESGHELYWTASRYVNSGRIEFFADSEDAEDDVITEMSVFGNEVEYTRFEDSYDWDMKRILA